MAVTFYADRGFLVVNGKPTANIKSIELTIDEAVTVVDTMTANKRSAGFKKGNRKVSGTFELEIEDQRAAVDLAFQYGNEVDAIVQVGAAGDRYQVKALTQNTQSLKSSVGDAGKTISFSALDAVNENGPAVNAQWGF